MGPPLAAFLLEVEGIRAPFLVLLAVLAVCVPAIARIAEPPPEPAQSRAAVRGLLRRRSVHAALMLGAALQFLFGAFEALWSRFFKDLGASPTFIGVSLALFPIPLILLSPFGGRLADRYGARQAAVVANLASVPFVIAFGFASTPWLVASLALVNGVTQAVSMPGGQAAMARASPVELLAFGQGVYGAVGAIAAAIAAVSAASVYAAFGPRVTFTATSLVVVALSLGSYLWGRTRSGGHAMSEAEGAMRNRRASDDPRSTKPAIEASVPDWSTTHIRPISVCCASARCTPVASRSTSAWRTRSRPPAITSTP